MKMSKLNVKSHQKQPKKGLLGNLYARRRTLSQLVLYCPKGSQALTYQGAVNNH